MSSLQIASFKGLVSEARWKSTHLHFDFGASKNLVNSYASGPKRQKSNAYSSPIINWLCLSKVHIPKLNKTKPTLLAYDDEIGLINKMCKCTCSECVRVVGQGHGLRAHTVTAIHGAPVTHSGSYASLCLSPSHFLPP